MTTQALTIRISADANGAISVISQTTTAVNNLGNAGTRANSGVASLTGGVQNLGRWSGQTTSATASLTGGVNGLSRATLDAVNGTTRLNQQLAENTRVTNAAAGSNQNLSNSTGFLSSSLKVLGGVFATLGIANFVKEIVMVNAEFQSIRTSLATVVGGADNAKAVFSQISQFAASTPYEIGEITKAYIQMRTEGIAPSMEMMTSLGNTASARGVQISQLVAAVGDATRGQFERLLDAFGVSAEKSGDKIKFTYKSIETEVANSSTAIQAYLKKIGDTDFAGGMVAQSTIIKGALSNLEDAWNGLIDHILDDNKENAIGRWVATAASFLQDFDVWINGAVTSAQKLNQINIQIGQVKQSIQDHQNGGFFRQLYDGITGFDVNKELNKIDSLKKAQTKTLAEMAAEKNKTKPLFEADPASVKAEADKKIKATADAQEKFNAQFGTTTDKYKLELKKQTEALGHELTDRQKQMVHDQVFASEIHKNESAAKKSAHKEEAAALSAAKKEQREYQQLVEKFNGQDPYKDYAKSTAELQSVRKSLSPETFLLNEQKIAAEFEKNTVDLKAYNDELERHKKHLENVGDYNSTIDELTRNKNRGAITPEQYGLDVAKANAGLMNDAANAYPNAKIPNIPIEKAGEVIDKKNINDAAKETQKFHDEIIKTTAAFDTLGNSGKMAFDGLLGGISAVASAATSFGEEMTKLNDNFAKGSKDYSDYMMQAGLSEEQRKTATADYYKMKDRYESASFQAEISGARSIAGATAKMFSEKSAARKVFHGIEMGLAVVEMAMSAKKMVVDVAAGAANMFAQGGFAGFAGVAAMAAVMGGLGFAMSGGSSKVSDNTTPATVATGTVLGDPTATSNSIDNIIKTLNDIHAQEYPELKAMADNFKGVDRDLYQMQRDIARSTANFTNMQGIGIPTSPTGAGQSKNPLGSTGTIAANLGASVALGATGALSTAGLYAGAALINAGATSLGIGISTAAATSATMAGSIGSAVGAGVYGEIVGGAILGLAGGLVLAGLQYGLGKLLGIGKVKYQQIGEGIVIESGKLMQDGMATAVDAQTWRKDIQTIKGWFSDKKTVIETYGQLSDEIYNSLNSMTANLTYGMMNAAQQLGAWDALSYKFTETASRPFLKIDFWKDGKRVDDTNKVLTEQINAWMDRTATAVFGTLFGEYQKIGEGMMETVSRLAGEVAVVKGSFAKMHLSVGDSNLGLVTFSDTLVQMYASSAKADDGLKNFVASMNDLYSFTMSKGQQSQDSIQKSKDFLGADFNVYDTQAVKDRTLEITTKIAEAQQKATDAEAKVKALQQPVQDYWNPVTDVDLSKLDPVFKGILGTSNYSGFQWENAGGGWNETMIRNRAAEHPDNELWQNIVLAGDNNRALKAAGAAAGGSTQTIEQNQADLAAAQKASTDAAADVVVLTNSLAYLKDSASATASLLATQSKYLDLTQTASEKTAREHADFIKENLSGLKDDLNKPPYSDTFKPILEAMGVFGKNVVVTAKDFQEALWKLENVQKAAKALADATKYFDGFTQNIKSWIQNLKATQLGSPESQFNAAKDNFAAQMKIINGGLATSAEEKQVALSGITGVADTYIAAIKNNYASTKEGQDLINQVVEQISGLTTSVDVQQLQLGVLQQIRDGVHAIPTGISDTQQEFFTSLATKIDSAQKTYISAPTSQNDLIANTLAKEWTMAVDYATKGSGFLDAFIKSFDGKTGLDAAVNLIFSDKSLNPVQAQTAIDNVLSRVISLVNIEVVPRFLTTVAQREIDQQIALLNPSPIYLNIDTTSAASVIKNVTDTATDVIRAINNLDALGSLTAINPSIYNASEMRQTVTPQLMQSSPFAVEPKIGGGIPADSSILKRLSSIDTARSSNSGNSSSDAKETVEELKKQTAELTELVRQTTALLRLQITANQELVEKMNSMDESLKTTAKKTRLQAVK